ncbi:MAG TPA: type II toxin-antitoxin system VapC family toxin [Sedimentisphaerales bacterium]|nr:type II toxin-antitoxin system VapC family toxin [Sedimentisphaerales bacterium]HQI27996.1 type II toxin-antitoxin system VapC family toxin [Sedimentisphaerales bacterium]
MNLLLDTHAFLWFIDGSAKLSQRARELIEDQGNAKLVSVASLWEMGLKMSLGRLELAQPFGDLIPRQMELNGFGLLPVRISHIARIISLPFQHRDPFDRMIVAQCVAEGLSVVSLDSVFDKYSVQRLW